MINKSFSVYFVIQHNIIILFSLAATLLLLLLLH